MLPRMSPALRAPPLFRCSIHPIALGSLQYGYATTEFPSLPTIPSDAGRHGAQRSEVKEEPAGRGTRTELSAMAACVSRVFMEISKRRLRKPQERHLLNRKKP